MVIVAVIWYGFRWADRISKQRGKREIGRDEADAATPAETADAEDMAKCEICGTFVPARGVQDCGREGCPYPR